jgi:membrane-associated protease RseP (regulator of RpoE activity)
MNYDSENKFQDTSFKTVFLMYTGAFLFAIILLIFVHELGHYLAFRWKGYEAVSIRITPFFGATSTKQDIQKSDAAFIILGGTVFNLSTAAIFAIIFRKVKSPYLTPLKMYPTMAFLVEGMVIIGGLFFNQTITDFAMLIEMGWPQVWVGTLGLILILIGAYLNYKDWMLFDIYRKNAVRKLLWLNSQYILYSLAGYFVSQLLLPKELLSIKEFLAICMVLHWAYLGIRILLAPRIFHYLNKTAAPFPKITQHASVIILILGCLSWIASFFILN